MKRMKKTNVLASWRLIIFLLALPLAVWSCGSDAGGDEATEEDTEMMDDAGPEHMDDEEHPAPADTMAHDSTEHSEHPGGDSEHPGN